MAEVRESPLTSLAPQELVPAVLERARAAAGDPVAMYVLDLDGTCLVRLAGDENLPARIATGRNLSAQMHRDHSEPVLEAVAGAVEGGEAVPLWTGHWATAVLVTPRGGRDALGEVAELMGLAVDVGSRLTDIFDCARRMERTSPAAELQWSLLPPRSSRLAGASLAANILPAYEVGGDWFDHAHLDDVVRFSVADAAGKGPYAAAIAAIALGALRAARRGGCDLAASAAACHEAVCSFGDPATYVTAILARWEPDSSRVAWINCGHPPPLVCRRDGTVEEVWNARNLPFGLGSDRSFDADEVTLGPGDRFVLYSDGITDRRTDSGGFFGLDRLSELLRETRDRPAVAVVSAVVSAVAAAGDQDIRDDATLLVLAADGG